MTFQKYQMANNAKGQLDVGISAVATNLILKSGFGTLFPTHNGTTDKNYLGTLVKYDTDGVTVLKREIVKVTARSTDTFTIERSAGNCPGSDTATTQGTTAYSFDADDYFFLNNTTEIIEDIQNELEAFETQTAIDIAEKLDISEYQEGQYVYGASSGGTDSYAITLPNPPVGYTIGQVFRFQADIGNTGSASLNVNSLGSITIKKLHDQDLETGDIEAGQIVTVCYDGTNFQMDSQVALIPSVSVEKETKSFVLGETMTLGSDNGLFFIGNGTTRTQVKEQLTFDSSLATGNGTNIKTGFSFTTPVATDNANILEKIVFYIEKASSPGNTLVVKLYASDKTTLLATGTINSSNPLGFFGEIEVSFADYALSANTAYFVEFSRTDAQSATNYRNIKYKNSDVVSGFGLSTYNGSSRTDSANDLYFKIYYKYSYTAGRIYKTDPRYGATNIVHGQILGSGSAGSTVSCLLQGLYSSTLSKGQIMYAKDAFTTNELIADTNRGVGDQTNLYTAGQLLYCQNYIMDQFGLLVDITGLTGQRFVSSDGNYLMVWNANYYGSSYFYVYDKFGKNLLFTSPAYGSAYGMKYADVIDGYIYIPLFDNTGVHLKKYSLATGSHVATVEINALGHDRDNKAGLVKFNGYLYVYTFGNSNNRRRVDLATFTLDASAIAMGGNVPNDVVVTSKYIYATFGSTSLKTISLANAVGTVTISNGSYGLGRDGSNVLISCTGTIDIVNENSMTKTGTITNAYGGATMRVLNGCAFICSSNTMYKYIIKAIGSDLGYFTTNTQWNGNIVAKGVGNGQMIFNPTKKGIFYGTGLIGYSDTVEKTFTNTVMITQKEFKVQDSGQYALLFDIKTSGNYTQIVFVYVNGILVCGNYITNVTTYATKMKKLNLVEGDFVEIKAGISGGTGYITNLYLKYNQIQQSI